MKTLKFRKINFAVLVLISLALLSFYYYFSFQHVGVLFKKSMRDATETDVDVTNKEIFFDFIPDRDNVSGLIVGVQKKMIIQNEKNISLVLDVSYGDMLDNSIVRRDTFTYPLSSVIFSGYNIFHFPRPLANSRGQKVTVAMRLSGELSDDMALRVGKKEYRILYRESARNIIGESVKNLKKDPKFYKPYSYSLLILLIAIVLLVVFSVDNDSRRE